MNFYEIEKKIDKIEEKLKSLHERDDIDKEKLKAIEEKFKRKIEKFYSNLTPYQKVLLARHPNRPKFLDYVNNIFKDFVELKGDRFSGECEAIVCGFAKFYVDKEILKELKEKVKYPCINLEKGYIQVCLIGQERGKTTKEKLKRNFGMPNPQGYRKALRVMKLAEKLGKPILTFIDTPGAFPGIEAEKHSQSEAIARNLYEMSKLKVPIISTVIGEGGSGGALGIGVANVILMLENSVYSVISPEGCSAILFKSQDKVEEAAKALKLTAQDLYKFKIIDEIIKEPLGGAHRYPEKLFETVRETLLKFLKNLLIIEPQKIKQLRYEKYRNIGMFQII